MNQNKEKQFQQMVEYVQTFEEMSLPADILRGIYSYGFEEPSEIQKRAIIPLIEGKDVIAQAQSGTGKTGTFTIGSLSRVNPNLYQPQVLVLAPTRELAEQIKNVMAGIGKNSNLFIRATIGGRKTSEDVKAFKRGVHVVVGTPGRVIDLFNRGYLSNEHIKTLIIDEADEMLNMGFRDDIKEIFGFLHEDVQVGIFSATLPPQALDLTKKFMNNPISVLVKPEELTLEGISQFHVYCERQQYKYAVLKDLYEYLNIGQAIIFCNSKRCVDKLREDLERDNFTVSSIHGDVDPRDRREIMQKFRTGGARILLATDLIARGIDVQQVSVVINYDLPRDIESYLHKVGRSGRHGKKGLAISFITRKDCRGLEAIERFYDTKIDPLPENIEDYL